MKRILLATTAVAAFVAFSGKAQAQDPGMADFGATEGGGGSGSAFTVKTSGAVKFYLKYASPGRSPDHRVANFSGNDGLFTLINAELEINGAATTDNGTDITTHIDFNFSGNAADESATSANATIGGGEQSINLNNFAVIDELSMKIAGGWGSIEVGGNDGAEDILKTYGAAVAAGTGGIDGDQHAVGGGYNYNGGRIGGSAGAGDSGDALKLTYMSPVFAGVQAGVSISYVTESADDTDGGTLGAGVGIKYSGSSGGVSYSASAVWGDDTLVADNRTKTQGDGFGGVGVGVKVGVAGVTIVLPVTVDNLGVRSREAATYLRLEGLPTLLEFGDDGTTPTGNILREGPELAYQTSGDALLDAAFGGGVDVHFSPGISYAIPGGKANVSLTTNLAFRNVNGRPDATQEAHSAYGEFGLPNSNGYPLTGFEVALSADYAVLPGVTLATDLLYGQNAVIIAGAGPLGVEVGPGGGFSGVIRAKASF